MTEFLSPKPDDPKPPPPLATREEVNEPGKKKKRFKPAMFMGDDSLNLGIGGKTIFGGDKL